MTIYVQDTFTDTDATNVPPHAGETGASWATLPTWNAFRIASNGIYPPGTFCWVWASGTPPVEYDVIATVIFRTVAGPVRICGRQDSSAQTGYQVIVDIINATTARLYLVKVVAGSQTILNAGGWYDFTVAAGSTKVVVLRITNAKKSALLDGVEVLSDTDNSISAAGKVAVRADGAATSTTGIHILDIVGQDVPAPPGPQLNRFSGEMKTGTEALLADTSNRPKILAKYARLLVYPPFFNQELTWYPGWRCWAYHNAIRTQDLSMPRIDYMAGYTPGSAEVWWAADIRTQQWRDYWVNRAKNLYNLGYRALRVDDLNPDQPVQVSGGAAYTPSWWIAGVADFLEYVRAQLPKDLLLEGNISKWWTWGLSNRSVSNPDLLRWINAIDQVELERGFNDPNLNAGDRTLLLNDWHGLMKDRGKGWVHFVQQGTLDTALTYFMQVNDMHYGGASGSPGWLLTNDAVAGMSWTGMLDVDEIAQAYSLWKSSLAAGKEVAGGPVRTFKAAKPISGSIALGGSQEIDLSTRCVGSTAAGGTSYIVTADRRIVTALKQMSVLTEV